MKGRRMRKGVISLLLVVVLVMSSMTVFAAGDKVAKIGNTEYATLQEAVDNATSGDTIVLLGDASGAGVKIDKDITIDFGGYTYTITSGVGSTGTTHSGMQLLKDNDVTLKNGTIEVNAGIYILIQNYANLTLDGMNLDMTGTTWPTCSCHPAGLGYPDDDPTYVVSNNNGDTVIKGGTEIVSRDADDYAFDVCHTGSSVYPSVSVTVEDATINGVVEYYNAAEAENGTLIINGGNFSGKLVNTENTADAAITVSAGTFNDESFKQYLAEGEAMEKDPVTGEYYVAVELTVTGVLDGVEVPESTEVIKIPKGYEFTEEDIEELKNLEIGDEDIEFVALAWDKEGTDVLVAGDVVDEDDTLYIILKTVETTPAPQDPTPAPQNPTQNTTTPSTDTTSPKTGDVAPVGLYVVIFAAAAVAVGGFRMRKVVR